MWIDGLGDVGGEAAYYRGQMTKAAIAAERRAFKQYAALGRMTRAHLARLYDGEYNAAVIVFTRPQSEAMRRRVEQLRQLLKDNDIRGWHG